MRKRRAVVIDDEDNIVHLLRGSVPSGSYQRTPERDDHKYQRRRTLPQACCPSHDKTDTTHRDDTPDYRMPHRISTVGESESGRFVSKRFDLFV